MAHKLLMILALIGMPAISAAATKLNLARSPSCGSDCAIDTVERATFELRGSNQRGARGLVGRVRIDGAMKGGRAVNATGLLVVIPLQDEPGVCSDHVVSGLNIQNGRTAFDFTARDFGDSISRRPGMMLPICGIARVVPAEATGYAPVLEAGFVLDAQRRRRRTVSRMALLPSPACGSSCPITRVGKSWIQLSSGGDAGDEPELTVRIRGARRGRTKVSMAAHVELGLHQDTSEFCEHVGAPGVGIRGGRSARTFTGAQLETGVPFAAGTVLSPCSTIRLVSDASPDIPVLSGGVVTGRDPDAENE